MYGPITCEICGFIVPEATGPRQKYCPDCAEVKNKASKRKSNKKNKEDYVIRAQLRKRTEKANERRALIDEINREAKAAGLSYGQYVARMYEEQI
jgi:ribosome-binding protein aMBF1 (putative translation factor)